MREFGGRGRTGGTLLAPIGSPSKKPTLPLFSSRTLWTVINASGVKSTVLSDKRGIIQVGRERVVLMWGDTCFFAFTSPSTPTPHPRSQRFRLGVPIRDMRLMDAAIFAPDAAVILVRDNALVLRIEHVRLIVTADEVLLPQDGAVGDAAGARFGAALLDAILDAVAESRARARAAATRAAGRCRQCRRPPPRMSPIRCRLS